MVLIKAAEISYLFAERNQRTIAVVAAGPALVVSIVVGMINEAVIAHGGVGLAAEIVVSHVEGTDRVTRLAGGKVGPRSLAPLPEA